MYFMSGALTKCGSLILMLLISGVLHECDSFFLTENIFSFADMFLYIFGLIVLLYVYRWFRELGRVPNKSEKFVYITGCDTGFGNLLARHLDTKGFRVIAGCYTEKGEVELKKACSEKLTAMHLDVTDNDSIKKATDTIKTLVGQKGKSPERNGDFLSISLKIF